MVFTALGVSKSLARAAFTAFWVLASLGWEMGDTYADEAGKGLSGTPAWPGTNPGYANILSQEVKRFQLGDPS